jgi:IS4 transposase
MIKINFVSHPSLVKLAYFNYRRFAWSDENGGYFVSRLKQNAKPEIADELREWRGSGSGVSLTKRA